MISASESSNKFQQIRFWKEKSVEGVVTLGPTTHVTLVLMNWNIINTLFLISCIIN
jgi:hypothetical protein